MTRLATPKINASSMADIAFLLLIFFLVTTTMEEEIGIKSILPPADTGSPSHLTGDHSLEIVLNADGDLLIENSPVPWSEIRKNVIDFYTVGKTHRTHITADICQRELKYSGLNAKEKMHWEWRLDACLLGKGSYWELNEKSQILLECSPSASYETYIALQDSLHRAVKDLRRSWCRKNGVKHYDKLNASMKSDRKIIRTLRLIYPIRIQDVQFHSE